ncbi:hypothetical protein L1987_55989 [Smallanthus sonchifolius]|uniref:Uncharacterized protein n=1 Tax=Smallanthus sonchifolius TaxID=185202 RepID=A0ACB9EAY1_9ASTR|nr:hypothetical protein L1987_55989 [Smallanthus sonchifolius]
MLNFLASVIIIFFGLSYLKRVVLVAPFLPDPPECILMLVFNLLSCSCHFLYHMFLLLIDIENFVLVFLQWSMLYVI